MPFQGESSDVQSAQQQQKPQANKPAYILGL